MSYIQLKGLCKKYPNSNKNSVTDFNLEIEEKEFIAFVGPSGCGKSTTLRMIAGFEDITAGELYIDGKLMNDVLPRDRGISMVFQNYALYPHMTVEKNISYGLKNMKVPNDEIKRNTAAESRRTSPAVSVRGLRWVALSSRIQRCSLWTNRCQTLTQSSASA